MRQICPSCECDFNASDQGHPTALTCPSCKCTFVPPHSLATTAKDLNGLKAGAAKAGEWVLRLVRSSLNSAWTTIARARTPKASQAEDQSSSISAEEYRFCPSCGASWSMGATQCGACTWDAAMEQYSDPAKAVEAKVRDSRARLSPPGLGRFHPRGVKFSRVPPEAIEAEARRVLKLGDRQAGAEGLSTGCGSISGMGCCLIIAFCALLIPGIGVFCFAGALLAMLLVGLGGAASTGSGAWAFLRPVDSRQLRGLCYSWRNMISGNCPICQAGIWLVPASEADDTYCPVCGGPLHAENDVVSPL